MTSEAYPSAPGHLHGRAVVLPALVRAPRSSGRVPVLASRGGRTLGGLLLAAYGPGSTLAYHELLGVVGLIRFGLLPAAWITHAHVDDAVSVAGGRAIWAIPKVGSAFDWEETARGGQVTVSLPGRHVVSVSFTARPRAVRVPLAAPFAGRDGTRRAWVLGCMRGTPVTASVRVTPDSPLASLGAVFARTALVGDVALRIGPPHAHRSHRARPPPTGGLRGSAAHPTSTASTTKISVSFPAITGG